MNASEAAVARVQEALGCSLGFTSGKCIGTKHLISPKWTDRGCPVAVTAADAAVAPIAAQTLRDAAKDFDEFSTIDETPVVVIDAQAVRHRIAKILRDAADRIEADDA